MNKYFKTMNRMILVGLCFPIASLAQTHRAYADELFKKADYYHAFFLYRNLYGTNLSENQFAQRCNQAILLTKQFLDLRASKQYYDARAKLRELLEINSDDFHAPLLPQMSIEEATYWHKLALKQNSAKEINLMLEKAIALYEQGKLDGWNHKEIDDAIKQCDASKVDSGISEDIAKTTTIVPKIELAQTPSIEPTIIEIKPEIVEKQIPTQIKIVKTRNKKILPYREVATIK